MKPLLVKLADGREYRLSELVDSLSKTFSLTDKEMLVLLPSGI